jgi:hypothetical protein
MSYTDVSAQMEMIEYHDDYVFINSELSVAQAVECVRADILEEIDGRDLARCIATENAGSASSHQAYTVSMQSASIYLKDRHVDANFNNSRKLRRAMKNAFGEVQFQQIILDYYWMPSVSLDVMLYVRSLLLFLPNFSYSIIFIFVKGWLQTHWGKSFFTETLPDLVRNKLISFPRAQTRTSKSSNIGNTSNANTGNNGTPHTKDNKTTENDKNVVFDAGGFEEGVVFLPFCAHVCIELLGAIKILKNFYAITFVKKSELPGHILWKGTTSIDVNVMQHILGKRLDQEEICCTFDRNVIKQTMVGAHVNEDELMGMLSCIEDFDNIRMIRLRPLRQHEPPSEFRINVIEPEEGGFIGLNWGKNRKEITTVEDVRSLTDSALNRKTKTELHRFLRLHRSMVTENVAKNLKKNALLEAVRSIRDNKLQRKTSNLTASLDPAPG